MAKKIILSLIGVAILLIVIFTILLFIDVARPVTLPPESITATTTQISSLSGDIVRAYLASLNFNQAYYGGKVFFAFEKLGETISGTHVIQYVWATFQEYYVKNGQLEKGTGTSIPLALYFTNAQPVTFNAPRDGSLYHADIQRYFPDSIKQLPIFLDTAERNEYIGNLQQEIRTQAENFFDTATTSQQ